VTLRLVSEARPIPWEHLSEFEKKELRGADAWINEVIEDAARPKPTANEIDQHKSGRVLFIDGQRGAGKTSLLLTLLERWGRPFSTQLGSAASRSAKGDEADEARQGFSNRRILLPILDFDPLPRDMPLHGWLLEPWRKEARRLEQGAGACADGKDLVELWTEVFERAVLGWSPATVDGKGVLERALAYQEQASGWIDTRDHWYNLVNTAVCRFFKCTLKDCKAAHPFAFVVAIDDVDLQVEQVPHLIHAIRLLHHPNVVYVLTGNMEHLSFLLELDYIRQHGANIGDVEPSSFRRYAGNRSLSEGIKAFSSSLRDALLEKALPPHSRIELPLLSLETVLNMYVGSKGGASQVADMLTGRWRDLAAEMKSLRIVTVRRAQHAIDQHLSTPDKAVEDPSVRFIADICGASVDDRGRISCPGRLTTLPGPVDQTWEGDRLTIQLRGQPSLALQLQFMDSNFREGEEANRVAAIRLAAERGLAKAAGLVWSPDAGIATTEVRWESTVDGVDGLALFHWPWLVRPQLSEVLLLGELAKSMIAGAGNAVDSYNLDQEMVLVWLRQNIEWQYHRANLSGDSWLLPTTWNDVVDVLRRLCAEKSTSDDACRWVRELLIMSAPYFGLPDHIASILRAKVSRLVPEQSMITVEENRMVGNAILVWRLENARRLGRSSDSLDNLSSAQVDEAVSDFLRQRDAVSLSSRKNGKQSRVKTAPLPANLWVG